MTVRKVNGLYARRRANTSDGRPVIAVSGSTMTCCSRPAAPFVPAETCREIDRQSRADAVEREAAVTGYAVRSTEDEESAGGYFVTGTVKDLVPTW
ncbi:hypothetical protein GCM10010987_12770 [Bradyrhizobium guangdongense]|uniref:Uncharacterized protein n=1 Tax=Bradyrhizobium guangdongense TaxID=1325090 RepID=A0AA88B6Y6_9BRAD|nr:hypothetical protein GCM10010987_12770 [Bradyrhizobium guangdongense]